jgi:hypothetical protein
MQSKQRMIVAATVASIALVGGSALGGGVAGAAKKGKPGGKSVRVANGKSRTIPDAVAGGNWGALPTALRVSKRFKGSEVADVRLTIRTTGLAVGAAGELLFRVTAPNGRTVDIAAGFTGQSIGPLTVTANSPVRICNSPPCPDPNARLGPPYFGTLGDPNLALLNGSGASGRWVVTAYDQSTGDTSALNSVGLVIRTR